VKELDDLGAALARTVSALERVRLDALEPTDRDLVVRLCPKLGPLLLSIGARTGHPSLSLKRTD